MPSESDSRLGLSNWLLIVLLWCLSAQPGFTQSTHDNSNPTQEPMRVLLIERCNPAPQADTTLQKNCLEVPAQLGKGQLVLAYGQIERDSADVFAQAVSTLSPDAIVILQSFGGDLVGGLRLGQVIRAKGMNTYLSTVSLPMVPERIQGKCFSACAYAFLGGVIRQIDTSGQYGVHQFRGTHQPVDPIQTQKLAAILGRYMDSMGVNRQLLDRALLTEPGKVILISKAQRDAWRVENGEAQPAITKNKWRMEVVPGGKRLAYATQTLGQGNLTLALDKRGVDTRLLVILRPKTTNPNNARWEELFITQKPVSAVLQLKLSEGLGSHSYTLSPLSSWLNPNPQSLGIRQIWYPISNEIFVHLQKAQQISIQLQWNQDVLREFNEPVTFGTAGLADTLLAL